MQLFVAASWGEATGDYVLIQDTDLEYDSQTIRGCFEPLVQGKADVVYGSRFLGRGSQRVAPLLAFGGE